MDWRYFLWWWLQLLLGVSAGLALLFIASDSSSFWVEVAGWFVFWILLSVRDEVVER